MQQPQQYTAIKIPCCICGTMILPNNANQCNSCLAREFDLKSILQRGPGGGDLYVYQCRNCRKFERVPGRVWDYLDIESPELLSSCLKQIPALSSNNQSSSSSVSTSSSPAFGGSGEKQHIGKIHLVDAMWVWTEPHSMRFKIRLTVRTEIQNVTIQQRVMVTLIQKFKQCIDCNREYTNRTWSAIVQVRQKHRIDEDQPRRGLNLVENAVGNNETIRKDVLKIDITKQGFDFYFMSLDKAKSFASFIAKIVPLKIKTTQKLVSTDVKNNTANIKHTVSCDMVPLCKDDLVMIHKKAGSSGSGNLAGRLCLVIKMSSTIHLVDGSPRLPKKRNASTNNNKKSKNRNKNKTANNCMVTTDAAKTTTATNDTDNNHNPMKDSMADLSPETYYKNGGEKAYRVLSSSRRMIRFVVLDIELLHNNNDRKNNSAYIEQQEHEGGDQLYEGPSSGIDKFALAEIEVIRESDLGTNDNSSYHCKTHLGHLLQVGDVVLGYDLASLVISSTDEFAIENCLQSNFVMPDIVLVKKLHGGNGNNESSNADTTGEAVDKDDNTESSRGKKKSSSMSKRKERQRKKKEKKARELQEAAERMGFIEADDEEEEDREGMLDEGEESENFDDTNRIMESSSNTKPSENLVGDELLINDPDFVAELNATEEELLATTAPSK